MPKLHELKTLPGFFRGVVAGYKRFELRKNDRDFQAGDEVLLREWTVTGYTGRTYHVRIVYVLEGHESLAPGYAALGIEPVLIKTSTNQPATT